MDLDLLRDHPQADVEALAEAMWDFKGRLDQAVGYGTASTGPGPELERCLDALIAALEPLASAHVVLEELWRDAVELKFHILDPEQCTRGYELVQRLGPLLPGDLSVRAAFDEQWVERGRENLLGVLGAVEDTPVLGWMGTHMVQLLEGDPEWTALVTAQGDDEVLMVGGTLPSQEVDALLAGGEIALPVNPRFSMLMSAAGPADLVGGELKLSAAGGGFAHGDGSLELADGREARFRLEHFPLLRCGAHGRIEQGPTIDPTDPSRPPLGFELSWT